MKNWTGIICVILTLLVLANLTKALFGGRQEGIVKTEDCRTTVQISQNDIRTYYKKFTCTYDRTSKGKFNSTSEGRIRSGICHHISTTASSNKCDTDYIYKFDDSWQICQEPEKPYLAHDDKCYPPCKASHPYRGLGINDNKCYDTPQQDKKIKNS